MITTGSQQEDGCKSVRAKCALGTALAALRAHENAPPMNTVKIKPKSRAPPFRCAGS